jgi:hypothetical protein
VTAGAIEWWNGSKSGTGHVLVRPGDASRTQADAYDCDQYLGLELEPKAPGGFELSHLLVELGTSVDGRYFVRSSLDGFKENLAAGPLLAGGLETYFISLIGRQSKEELGAPLELRIYFHNLSEGALAWVGGLKLYAARAMGL